MAFFSLMKPPAKKSSTATATLLGGVAKNPVPVKTTRPGSWAGQIYGWNLKPPVAPQPPAAPPGPAAPTSQTPDLTSDVGYQDQAGAINKAKADTLSALAAQEGAVRKGYGIEDNSDPYSRAALLQQDLQRNQRTTSTGMAAAGHLYSGSNQNAQNRNQRNYDVSYDSLQKAYQAALANIAQQRSAAETGAQGQIGQAEADALSRWIQSRPAADEVPQDQPDAASPSPASPAAKAKSGYQFVMKSGPNAGLSYNLVLKNGQYYRRFENGKLEAR